MRNDKELLELAAKAAGVELWWSPSYDADEQIDGHTPTYNGCPWNPLTDDGDALRLAVKLKLLSPDIDPFIVTAALDSTDPYAATRRAIVRAAAEIGKGEQ